MSESKMKHQCYEDNSGFCYNGCGRLMNRDSALAYDSKTQFAFEFQIRINGEWKSIAPTGCKPYQCDTRQEAERTLKMCYPDQVRAQRLGGDICARVIEVEKRA
jgi:hypothetical protein